MITEKGKQKIRVELLADGKLLTEKDSEKMRDILVGGIKEVTRNSSAKVPFGTYRGFDMLIARAPWGGRDGFRIILQGANDQQFQPDNLRYSFDDKLSLSGLFQRMDNWLAKGLDEIIEVQRENAKQERAELETVTAALGKEFPQQEELALARENHGAVIRELQRMQDDANYVSTWTPKTSLADEQQTTTEAQQPKEEGVAAAREDAARRGLKETPAAESAAPASALGGETFRERLADAGFHPTGSDFYGKNEHSKTMDAGDGGIFQMRIFQTADNQTGLHVQYEKYNMIDGSRTVDTQFGTLDEAMEFVGDYQKTADSISQMADNSGSPMHEPPKRHRMR